MVMISIKSTLLLKLLCYIFSNMATKIIKSTLLLKFKVIMIKYNIFCPSS